MKSIGLEIRLVCPMSNGPYYGHWSCLYWIHHDRKVNSAKLPEISRVAGFILKMKVKSSARSSPKMSTNSNLKSTNYSKWIWWQRSVFVEILSVDKFIIIFFIIFRWLLDSYLFTSIWPTHNSLRTQQGANMVNMQVEINNT